jgi:hypothetical protein
VNLVREVGVIAHSCGVEDPRDLGREHCRIVTGPGRSAPLSRLHPGVEAGSQVAVRQQPSASEAA